MQAIISAVGKGAANAVSDVALIEAMLVKISRPAAAGRAVSRFLATYNGTADQGTIDAITAFQGDHNLLPATRGSPATARGITAGYVAPGDATWRTLVQKVPADFSDMRILVGGRTVYLGASSAEKQVRLNAAARATFTSAFQLKVVATINKVYADHHIAVGVCRLRRPTVVSSTIRTPHEWALRDRCRPSRE